MYIIKSGLQSSISNISQSFFKKESFNLSVEPDIVDHLKYEQLKEIYDGLIDSDKYICEGIYWELSKKEDSRVDGYEYGKVNFFDNLKLTARSLHRGGFIPIEYFKSSTSTTSTNIVSAESTSTSTSLSQFISSFSKSNTSNTTNGLVKINYTIKLFRINNNLKTQYYSLGEKYGNNLSIGYAGYVNGMGNTIGWAGRDASILSDELLDGIDLHCVYLPSYQISPDGFSPSSNDFVGFSMDAIRHLSINGGDYSKTSCLIAQQWIDYLKDNNDKYFLQIGASDGATFICSAVNLVSQYCPSILSRLSIILLAPGCFLLPNDFINSNQVLNFVKLEDNLITKLATNSKYIGKHNNIIIVPHNSHQNHPHNFLSNDFIQIVKPYINNFKSSGRLII